MPSEKMTRWAEMLDTGGGFLTMRPNACGRWVEYDDALAHAEGRAAQARRDGFADAARAAMGHSEECSAMKPFFGTGSEDPGCDCGYQAVTDTDAGRGLAELVCELMHAERTEARREALDEAERALDDELSVDAGDPARWSDAVVGRCQFRIRALKEAPDAD